MRFGVLWTWGFRLTIRRLNPVHGTSSPAVAPLIAPVPRRESLEMRGRANSSLNGETHGLERVVESLKIENSEYRKLIKELDDRCTPPSLPPSLPSPVFSPPFPPLLPPMYLVFSIVRAFAPYKRN